MSNEWWSLHRTVKTVCYGCIVGLSVVSQFCSVTYKHLIVHMKTKQTFLLDSRTFFARSEKNFEKGFCRGERETCFIHSTLRVLIRCMKFIKQTDRCSLVLWMWFYRHVSATHVPIFRVASKVYDFNCGVIPTQCKYICILALSTLKMDTWVAETCRLSPCIKIIFIKPKCIFSFLINCT